MFSSLANETLQLWGKIASTNFLPLFEVKLQPYLFSQLKLGMRIYLTLLLNQLSATSSLQ
jgi:hypothetical protein